MFKYVIAIVLVVGFVTVTDADDAGPLSDPGSSVPGSSDLGSSDLDAISSTEKLFCGTSSKTIPILEDLSKKNGKEEEIFIRIEKDDGKLNRLAIDETGESGTISEDTHFVPKSHESADEVEDDQDQKEVTNSEPLSTEETEVTEPAAAAPPPTPSQNPAKEPTDSKICSVCKCNLSNSPNIFNCSRHHLESIHGEDYWPEITWLKRSTVDYSYNNMTEIHAFHVMPISKLSLHANRIQRIHPGAFNKLKQLEYLDLSNNNLNHFSHTIFRRQFLPLKKLMLGHNQIAYIEEEAFDNVGGLLELILKNNPLGSLEGKTTTAITKLDKLEFLDLAEAQLIGLPDDMFVNLKALKALKLSDNQLITIPTALNYASGLKYLNINRNPITTLNNQSFTGLKQLERLKISFLTNLSSIEAYTFAPLESLKFLECSHNSLLKTIHPDAFNITKTSHDVKLSKFQFNSNGVSSIPANLLPWEDVDDIDIQGNPYMCNSSIIPITDKLIPIIVKRAPALTLNITCSGPPELRGMSLVGLKLDKSDIDTKMLPSAETPSSTETPSSAETPSSRKTTSPSNFKAGLLVVSLFGTLLIVGIVGCMGFWRERKKRMQTMVHKTSGRIVHYFRTPVERNDRREEMNILSQDYSECIMHEDY